MKRPFFILISMLGVLTAQTNIQLSVKGGTLYSKAIVIASEMGTYDTDGTETVYRQYENIEPYQIYLKGWKLTFESDTTNSRYELNRLAEFSVKDGITTIRYGAVFYGVWVNYKPSNCQLMLVITSKLNEFTVIHEGVYRKFQLSFMP